MKHSHYTKGCTLFILAALFLAHAPNTAIAMEDGQVVNQSCPQCHAAVKSPFYITCSRCDQAAHLDGCCEVERGICKGCVTPPALEAPNCPSCGERILDDAYVNCQQCHKAIHLNEGCCDLDAMLCKGCRREAHTGLGQLAKRISMLLQSSESPRVSPSYAPPRPSIPSKPCCRTFDDDIKNNTPRRTFPHPDNPCVTIPLESLEFGRQKSLMIIDKCPTCDEAIDTSKAYLTCESCHKPAHVACSDIQLGFCSRCIEVAKMHIKHKGTTEQSLLKPTRDPRKIGELDTDSSKCPICAKYSIDDEEPKFEYKDTGLDPGLRDEYRHPDCYCLSCHAAFLKIAVERGYAEMRCLNCNKEWSSVSNGLCNNCLGLPYQKTAPNINTTTADRLKALPNRHTQKTKRVCFSEDPAMTSCTSCGSPSRTNLDCPECACHSFSQDNDISPIRLPLMPMSSSLMPMLQTHHMRPPSPRLPSMISLHEIGKKCAACHKPIIEDEEAYFCDCGAKIHVCCVELHSCPLQMDSMEEGEANPHHQQPIKCECPQPIAKK